MFDVLIIGGGPAGMSCALLLGSAKDKLFAKHKKVGIFTHQKTSSLQEAIFNNTYGIPPGSLGKDLLANSLEHLSQTYPDVAQFGNEKIFRITPKEDCIEIASNRATYQTKIVVIAIGAANTFAIEGLLAYVEPHKRTAPEKNRIQLRNTDHLVAPNIYVAGTLAGERSQLPIVMGSGAAVAADILTLWNQGAPVQIHDSTKIK